ncbi:MAG: 4Fe-4S dicluster domain-containing protein [candidate division Zixibacteria bacterium]|nr:4Fe-4S dicluster domain-containing protein [candidate division Zixibacteria bacterium]
MTKRQENIAVLESEGLGYLVQALIDKGYEVLGPRIKDGAVTYDQIETVRDLPIGWTDRQEPGSYRLVKSGKKTYFDYAVGPHSWKKYLHPPETRLWEARRDGQGFTVIEPERETAKKALLGVRPCELQALAIQDTVFTGGPYLAPGYQERRSNLFIVAVNCVRPGGTCFCASMKTGPKATSGFDLALTEILESGRHYFVVEVGSASGEELLSDLPTKVADDAEKEAAAKAMERATAKMGRELDTEGIRELLYKRFDDPHWQTVADRCFSCGNCTMVCPTCFCVNVEDGTDLSGQQAERRSRWDSCFTRDFSYIHGGSIRFTVKARYRQWMTHKLAYWLDQFGTLGCVGCGRCITWCPAGIDITEEVRALRDKEQSEKVQSV